jgi:hypothetical protein
MPAIVGVDTLKQAATGADTSNDSSPGLTAIILRLELRAAP